MSDDEYSNKLRVSKRNKRRIFPTDVTAEDRRIRQMVDLYESDNFQDDKDAVLLLTKMASERSANVPKKVLTRAAKKKKLEDPGRFEKIAKYYKTFQQMVEEEEAMHAQNGTVSYMSIAAGDSKYPAKNFCAVCGYKSPYKCTTCYTKFCSVRCYKTHKATRCPNKST